MALSLQTYITSLGCFVGTLMRILTRYAKLAAAWSGQRVPCARTVNHVGLEYAGGMFTDRRY